jgi:hypothetical protein
LKGEAKFKAHVLTTWANFVDVFLPEEANQIPAADLEWSDLTHSLHLRVPPPAEPAVARAAPGRYKIISEEREKVFGKTGKGVLLAIIDGDIDYTLPEFWTSNNGSKESRLLYYWDVHEDNAGSGPEGSTKLLASYPGGKTIGRLYSRKEINDVLNGVAPATLKIDKGNRGGHGTGCASIAAGQGRKENGRDLVLPGVAPDADLIMIRSERLWMLPAIVEWLEQVAKDQNKPLVISLSQGTSWGAGYDGLRGTDQHLNARLDPSKKGFAACLCAGNEGRGSYNTRVVIAPNEEATIEWEAPFNLKFGGSESNNPPQIVFYFDTDSEKDIQVPDLVSKQWFHHAPSKTLRTKEFSVPKGKGKAIFKATGTRPVTVHAYLWSGWAMDNQGIMWSSQHAKGTDNTARINSPATIPNSITVASYNWSDKDGDNGKLRLLSTYSSPGPRRGQSQGRIPWLAAPGRKFKAPQAQQPQILRDMDGTSSATPYAAGFVALMFECNPNLTFEQVRQHLAATGALSLDDDTRLDGYSRTIHSRIPTDVLEPSRNDYWGYGRLDNEAANRILSNVLKGR